MTGLSPRARELQARLLRRYLDSLPEKQAELEIAWQALQDMGWNAEPLANLKTPVHRLAGSAGSYGLEELGLAARTLDKSLRTADPEPGQRDAIRQQFELLISALADAQKKT